MPILKSKFSILNWDKFHQKQISRQYKSVEICCSQLENSIQLKDVKIAVFMIFQKIISYIDCSFTRKGFSWHEKFVKLQSQQKEDAK